MRIKKTSTADQEGDNDLEAIISSFGLPEGLNQRSSLVRLHVNQTRAAEHCGQI